MVNNIRLPKNLNLVTIKLNDIVLNTKLPWFTITERKNVGVKF